MRRVLRTLVPLVLAALVVAGCTGRGGITVSAAFEDVIDLVPQASVRAGDVTIGVVTDIELTDDEMALVTMELDEGVVLPAETEAWLSKTSLLGERFIDMRPVGDTGQLEDGQRIASTRVVTDFEDLVGTGSEVLAAVSAQRLAVAVQAGAEAIGGRGALIQQVIVDVRTVVGSYEDGTDTLTTLIDELDLLTRELAPDAAANAADLELLTDVATSLDEQDEQLMQSLSDLQRLATVGERILEDHEQEFDDGVRRLRVLLEEVNRIEGELDDLLFYLPRHNLNVPDGSIDELAQIWGDFVLCTDDPAHEGDFARDCTPPNGNQQVPPPSRDACQFPSVRCPEEVRR